MRHIIIRDIVVDHDLMDYTIIDNTTRLDLHAFAEACGQPNDWVVALVEHSILEKPDNQPEHWQFMGEELARARRAWRLQRDFDANLTSVAVMLDLLDELNHLRTTVALYSH